ncbi:MAG: hypothetical protein GQ574_26445 [Crocinitomix sp.]|nr:hypothetical protein [Crocinitomix sp.]
MTRTIMIAFVLLSSYSCKKHELKNEKEILIGNWEWIFTEKEYGWCDNMDFEVTLNQESENYTCSINFEKKGYVSFYLNGVLENKYRVVFKHFIPVPNNFDYQAIIYLNNNKENTIGLQVTDDTLSVGSFPISVEDGCGFAKNYFIRE